MEVYSFFIRGPIVGKERPRKGRNGFYTPKKTTDYEAVVKNSFLVNFPKHKILEGPVYLNVIAFFPVINTKNDLPGKMCTKKPDFDNILKIICDALNGIAFTDDKNIVGVTFYKVFSLDEPGIKVEISGDL